MERLDRDTDPSRARLDSAVGRTFRCRRFGSEFDDNFDRTLHVGHGIIFLVSGLRKASYREFPERDGPQRD